MQEDRGYRVCQIIAEKDWKKEEYFDRKRRNVRRAGRRNARNRSADTGGSSKGDWNVKEEVSDHQRGGRIRKECWKAGEGRRVVQRLEETRKRQANAYMAMQRSKSLSRIGHAFIP